MNYKNQFWKLKMCNLLSNKYEFMNSPNLESCGNNFKNRFDFSERQLQGLGA